MFPANALVAFDARIKTEASAGPTQGVHAKLNVNPIMYASIGFIFPPIFRFILFSTFKKFNFIMLS